MDALGVELSSINFVPISQESNQYIGASFSDSVARAFPECNEDIDEAYKCLVANRFTASMFHVGRVMELAVKKYAIKICAASPVKDFWQDWLDSIQAVHEAMPYKTQAERDARRPYCEAHAYFFSFKEAWRNQAAHPKQTYTRDEALAVMANAKSFLQSVAKSFF